MSGQQQAAARQPEGERAQRNKAGPKRAGACKSSCSPPFDYLVPIEVCVTSQPAAVAPAPQQQPSVDEQPVVECISWSLFNRLTGQLELSKSVRCSREPADAKNLEGRSLAAAIQQVSSMLAHPSWPLAEGSD